MTLGQILVLSFVALNFISFVFKTLFSKESNWSFAKRIGLSLLFGVVPLVLFILGYLFIPGSFVPGLISFSAPISFWKTTFLVVLSTVVFNILITIFFPNFFKDAIDKDGTRDLIWAGMKPLKWIVLHFSINAGLFEEYIFHFVYFVSLQPVVFFVVSYLPIDLVMTLPHWLTLGSASLFSTPVLITAFFINIYFAYLHSSWLDKKNLWHRVIFAWFLGWIGFQSLLYLGLLGAMILHTAIDFCALYPPVRLTAEKLVHDYWKGKYGE